MPNQRSYGVGSSHQLFAECRRLLISWLGFCLDPCHAHAGGADLAGIVDRVMAITGRVDLVHANDSKDTADSGRDRHENLGKGQIDLDTLVGIVQAAGAPVICETPGPAAAHRADIELLRTRLGGR